MGKAEGLSLILRPTRRERSNTNKLFSHMHTHAVDRMQHSPPPPHTHTKNRINENKTQQNQTQKPKVVSKCWYVKSLLN